MRFAHLAARVWNTAHLLERTKADVIAEVVAARIDGRIADVDAVEKVERPQLEAFAAQRTQGRYYRTADGIAMIPVLGTLVQRGADGMDAQSGMESYESVGNQLAAAMADKLVSGVLLEVDSPGGEAAGCFALAEQIRAYAGEKPIVAHANEHAFSAAYALGVAAGEFYVAPTGMVGSVGTIMMHADLSSYDAKRGIRYTAITFGERKADFSSHEPLTDAALIAAQDMVDRLGETFVAHVASMRGIDADAVRNTQAALLHPDQALALGMIDGTLTLPLAVSRLRKLIADKAGSGVGYSRAAAAAFTPKGNDMQPDTKTNAAADELVAKAKAEGRTEGEAAGAAAAKAAERARIKAITGDAEAQGREALAAHLAHETDMGAEQAIALLKVSPKSAPAAAANALGARMASVDNPDLGLGAAQATGEETADDVAARILKAAASAGALRLVK